MNKEDACKYFYDVKPKHLANFDVETPQGHNIKGYICKKPNYSLGSLLITCLDNQKVVQFIQSFPKIHYYDHNYTLKADPDIWYDVLEKLDGSNLILYGLQDKDGNLIEIVPKTRGTAVADKHLYNLYKNYIDKKGIEKCFAKNPNDTIMFELYGIANQHEIIYPSTYIDIALIGWHVYQKGFIYGDFLQVMGIEYGFRTPYPMFSLSCNKKGEWELFNEKISYLSINYIDNCSNKKFPTLFDAIIYLREELQRVNQEYAKNNNGRIALEGVVINGLSPENEQRYIKIKPPAIEDKHRQGDNIKRSAIIKECYKYFDEYGSQVKDLYNEDKNHYLDYIIAQLSEEYPENIIKLPKNRKRIENCFFDVWETYKVPESLQLLCEEIVSQYPGHTTGELMGIFMREHPEMKRKNKSIYRIINILNK